MNDTAPLTVWRGCVNAWECDEMRHMNVRFYVAKWAEAMGATAAAIALPHAFRDNAASTLLPEEQHIRFHAEAREGAPLSMTARVLDIGETSARFLHELLHADGRPAATFVTRVRHADASHGHAFAWSRRSRERLEALRGALTDAAAARSIDLERTPADASRAAAETFGLPTIGLGMVTAVETGAFGRARPETFIGRISDSVPNLLSQWREETAKAAGAADGVAKEPGAAVVEFRLLYRAWPRMGDLFEVRSGITEVASKTQRLVHWVVDPVSGAPWFTGEAVVLSFDLKTRKAITPPAAQRAALAKRVVPGLEP